MYLPAFVTSIPSRVSGFMAGPVAMVGSIVAAGRDGSTVKRAIDIARLRVVALQNPENAKGPVAIAGLAGYYVGGLPGSLVAGFVASVGCALCSRMVPEVDQKEGQK